MKTVLLYNEKSKDSRDFAYVLSQYLYDMGVEIMQDEDRPCYSLEDIENTDLSSCDTGIVLGETAHS